ncbi:hypothetical protein B0T10DRAFT_420303 [Thelonectria olida]|uniref:Uncharacterized protein n=1 Tax=Thelonectria olida TaxID=1576542 RepID=A0A9P9AHG4_9HYPO|nr:hypothetical protein B0T10DRAFT_420303 [Thelonectria olida]
MVFESRPPKVDPPATVVFNFIFNTSREDYPSDRVLYRVHETSDTLTLEALETKSRQLATVLANKDGIRPNNVVAFLANNSIHYPVASFAVLATGATISPIPVQRGLDAKAIVPRLEQAEAKLIVTDENLVSITTGAAKAYHDLPLISLTGTPDGTSNIEELLSKESDLFDGFHLSGKEKTEEHNNFIYRTRSSSGNVKSFLTTHAHWAANLLTARLTVPADTNPEKDVWISSLPCAYGINAKLNLGLNILLGIPVIILSKPFDQSSSHLIDEHGITFLFVTPPLAAQIAKTEKKGGATYKSIRWLLMAGAPVHSKIRDSVQEKFNGVRLCIEWGTTETLLIALQIDEASSVPGSSGTLLLTLKRARRVIDLETGKDLGHNHQGEILVRSTLARFAGNKDNAEASKDFDSEGWFHFRNVGYVDENSNVFIIDRLKELLRVGDGYGTHALAEEFEAVLFDHPAVATAIDVGIRDQEPQQEHPAAVVVLRPEAEQRVDQKALVELAEELEAYVQEELGSFKRLSGGADFVERYPYVRYKINKRKLKELVNIGPTTDRSARWVEVAV